VPSWHRHPDADHTDGVRTVVTGGAGFIGSWLVDRLVALGHDVVVVDNFSTGREDNLINALRAGPNLTIHRANVQAPETLDLIARTEPEVVFHLAAQMDVRVSVADPLADATTNVLGSLSVFEAARRARTRKVVFTSSGGTVYGAVPEVDLPIGEDHAMLPVSPYGVAKKAVTDYLAVYRNLWGLDYTVLTLGNVYGPRQDPYGEAGVASIFASRLLAGEQCTIFGDGCQTRDFVFVADVVTALTRAAEDFGSGQVINVGTSQELSVRDLHDALVRKIGASSTPAYAPARTGELERNALDNTRAARVLGWRPETSLDHGLAQLVAWLRTQ
jgi:UDP-glucose 4-epimerase